MPIGIITEDTLTLFESNNDKHKYAALIHHCIAIAIYKELWLPSRQTQHGTVLTAP